jgi:hypothetical protein
MPDRRPEQDRFMELNPTDRLEHTSGAGGASDTLALSALEAQGAATAEVAPGRGATVREWIEHHDHKWMFVLVYLGLAVVLSVFVSLFWLVFMAAVHLLLECIRHFRPGWTAGQIVAHSAWEVKLDFALVLLALGAVLYIDVVMGVLGIQSAARAAALTKAGARTATRIAAWERNVRAFLLTIDEMIRVGRAATMLWRRRGGEAAVAAVAGGVRMAPWRERWGTGDRISVGLIAACVLLIVMAPLLTAHGWSDVVSVLAQELRPMPS